MVIADILSAYERIRLRFRPKSPELVWGWALKEQNRKDWPRRPMFEKSRNKQPLIGSRRAEEGVEIDQDLRRERGSTRGMVDGQPAIIRENEWVGPKRFATVLAPFRETPNPSPKALFVVHNELLVVLLYQSCQSTRSCPDRACQEEV